MDRCKPCLPSSSALDCLCLGLYPLQDDDNTKEALRYSAALLGELRTTLLR